MKRLILFNAFEITVLQIRCSVHRTNLALSDLPRSMPEFTRFKADRNKLLSLFKIKENKSFRRGHRTTSKILMTMEIWLPFPSQSTDYHLLFDMLDHFRIFIEAIEQDFITLPRSHHECLKVLALFLVSAKEQAKGFAGHLEERFQSTADGTPTQLSHLFS
jgi:hypothetical protein